MRWGTYYEKLEDWTVSTAVSRMSQLESLGPPEEVTDAIGILGFEDEKGATGLLKKATSAGVKFTGDQLSEICLVCEEGVLNQAILFSADGFTGEDLEALYCNCDDDLLIRIAQKYKLALPEDLAGAREIRSRESEVPKKGKTKVCPHCGAYAASNFCPDCGRDLRSGSPNTAAPGKVARKPIYLGDVKISPEQFEELRRKMASGEKQEAIQKIRHWTALSLGDAVHIAENFYSLDFRRPQALICDSEETQGRSDNTTSPGLEKTRTAAKTAAKGLGLAALFGGYGIFRIISGLVKPYMRKRK